MYCADRYSTCVNCKFNLKCSEFCPTHHHLLNFPVNKMLNTCSSAYYQCSKRILVLFGFAKRLKVSPIKQGWKWSPFWIFKKIMKTLWVLEVFVLFWRQIQTPNGRTCVKLTPRLRWAEPTALCGCPRSINSPRVWLSEGFCAMARVCSLTDFPYVLTLGLGE